MTPAGKEYARREAAYAVMLREGPLYGPKAVVADMALDRECAALDVLWNALSDEDRAELEALDTARESKG